MKSHPGIRKAAWEGVSAQKLITNYLNLHTTLYLQQEKDKFKV